MMLSLGVWEIIQSKTIGSYLSQKVSTIVSARVGDKISFERVEIKLFPPGIEVVEVRVKELSDPETNGDLFVQLDSITLNFNLLDIFKT